ncbi:hypothetical protein AVEN_9698-1 [Araneus ventricosus]|uniref:Uncharacterized protein n=1 Tax=Araneus ventricosus TaxID=182803 RepID=A0A4Y2DYX1_ARAVE|nr:hypothetical protein AVEN_9698-1 [Araneus ventricosus]
MENDALFQEYSRKHEAQMTRGSAFVQISSINRQQITNNNSNSTFSAVRRLSSSQLALWTKLQRDSRRSNEKTSNSRRHSLVSGTPVFIVFPTGRNVIWNHPEQSLYFCS